MRVRVLRPTLVLALAVFIAASSPASAEIAASNRGIRGLRASADTNDLGFDDLQGDVASGLSFSAIAGSAAEAPGSIREVAVANGSRGPQDASAGADAALTLQYSRPTGDASFYDVVGDLSSKWARFGDEVPVPSGAKLSLATVCDGDDLDTCVRACASSCFANNACQWFTLAPTTKDCYLYRSLRPIAGETFAAVAADAQRIAGYVKAGPPALLSAKAVCTETVVYNTNDSFCVTADATFYLSTPTTSSGTTQCAASPLSLVRAFQNNYFNKGTENALTEELANGKLKNAAAMAPSSAGGEFSVDSFLKYLSLGDADGSPASLVVSTADMTVDSLTLQLADAGTKTQWTYAFDTYGRVTSVSSSLSHKNLLFAKDATTGKMTERKDYSKPGLQTRYSYSIHALSAVNAQPNPLSFGAGEIASSLFTSPNGFWNFVPLSDKSRVTGCWKQANDLIAKLLEWGFVVDFKAAPKYFTSADAVKTEASEASMSSNDLFTEGDVDQFYSSTGTGVGDLNFHADFPCAYLHRPYKMDASIKLKGCKEGSYCSGAWPAINKSTDKTFFTVTSNGDVQVSRPFAHWAFENTDGGVKSTKPTFTYLKALATASSGLCFTETGKSLQSLTLSSTVEDVLLVTKDGKCVSLGATDGTPTIVDCDGNAQRVSFDGASSTCIVGSGESCPSFSFSTSVADGIKLAQRDDLVTGTLVFGAQGCVVVDGAKVSFTTDKSDCSPIKASYVTLAATGGDPVDPDTTTDTASSQTTVAVPPRKREIDDPDPESNP